MVVGWLSLDPVRQKIDFYPKLIASRIESAYSSWLLSGEAEGQVVLGCDFFNATIHFSSQRLYQTTPGIHMGRQLQKVPGYRTVKRIVVTNPADPIDLYGRCVHGEWRLCEPPEAEHTFREALDEDCLVNESRPGAEPASTEDVLPWTAANMNHADSDRFVVVWQWCRGTVEADGNVLLLPEHYWCP